MSNSKTWIVTKDEDNIILFNESNWQDCLAQIVRKYELNEFGIKKNKYKCYQVFSDNGVIFYIKFNFERNVLGDLV